MPVTFGPPPLTLVRCAPGNTVTINGSGFGAAPGTLELLNQGPDGTQTTNVTPSSWSDTEIVFVVPDGCVTGFLQVANTTDSTTQQVPLKVVSQYVQAAEFVGTGFPTDDLAAGELDTILQDASTYADGFMGGTKRLLQTNEKQTYHKDTRRIYPACWPIVSIDAYVFQLSNYQVATINVGDIVLNERLRYGEILSYTIANFELLGEIQNLGFAANIGKLTYTHGWKWFDVPADLQAATKLIAAELLTQRKINASGLSGFASVKQGNQQYDRRSESFAIPQPAKELLRPYVLRRLA